MGSPHVMKAVEALVSVMGEMRRLDAKELKAIAKLNRALKGTGYRLVSEKRETGGRRPGSPRGSRNKNTRLTLHAAAQNGIGKIRKKGPGGPRLKRIA